jgi:hypothetical protein
VRVASPILGVVFCLMRRWDRIAKTKLSVGAAWALFGGPVLAIRVFVGGRMAPLTGGVLLEVASLTVCSIVLAKLLLGERFGVVRMVRCWH